MFFKIEVSAMSFNGIAGTMFRVGFGDPAQNDAIVAEVEARLTELKRAGLGGRLAFINGPASLPVMVAIGHHLGHLFGAVGVFDPKLDGYVISVSHGSELRVGSFISAEEIRGI